MYTDECMCGPTGSFANALTSVRSVQPLVLRLSSKHMFVRETTFSCRTPNVTVHFPFFLIKWREDFLSSLLPDPLPPKGQGCSVSKPRKKKKKKNPSGTFQNAPAGVYISRIATMRRRAFSRRSRQLQTCHHLRPCKSYGITCSLEMPAGRPLDRAAGVGEE